MDLSNPGIWSAFIAVLALILSQLPPIRELIKGRKIKIIVPEMFMLSHVLGNIEISLSIDLHNNGGKFVSIAKLDLFFVDSQNIIWKLPAITYFSRQQPPQAGIPLQEFLLGSISLKPGDHWNETIHCYRIWSETEEEEVNEIQSKISKNILQKRAALPPNAPNVEADEKIVNEAKIFFEKLFNLHKGNYQFIVACLSENESIISVRGFEFTLFESNINALRSQTEEYKYGFGIYIPMPFPTKIVRVRLKPIADNNQVRQVYERIHLR